MTTYNDILEEFDITPGMGDCDRLLDAIQDINYNAVRNAWLEGQLTDEEFEAYDNGDIDEDLMDAYLCGYITEEEFNAGWK